MVLGAPDEAAVLFTYEQNTVRLGECRQLCVTLITLLCDILLYDQVYSGSLTSLWISMMGVMAGTTYSPLCLRLTARGTQ